LAGNEPHTRQRGASPATIDLSRGGGGASVFSFVRAESLRLGEKGVSLARVQGKSVMGTIAGSVHPIADAVIKWPANFSLAAIIEALRDLNRALDLRCAVDTERETEYLFYKGSALDVFEIALPEPASDQLLSSLTRVNRESWRISTDHGDRRYGPHRLERNARGGLLVRPRLENVEEAAGRFAFAYQGIGTDRQDIDQIVRFQSRWGILRRDFELWEVDFAYLPTGHFDHPNGQKKTDREWWETIPIGTISFIGEHDLPMEVHVARSRAIIASGSTFSVIGDLERHEYRVYRLDGVAVEREAFTLLEMPWFAFPELTRS
jgi:hypothetical protein